jgi:hypothetical protein
LTSVGYGGRRRIGELSESRIKWINWIIDPEGVGLT